MNHIPRTESYGKYCLGLVLLLLLLLCIAPSSIHATSLVPDLSSGADIGNIDISYSTNGCDGCPTTSGSLRKTDQSLPGYYNYLAYTTPIGADGIEFEYTNEATSIVGPYGDSGRIAVDSGNVAIHVRGYARPGRLGVTSFVGGLRNGYDAFVRANARMDVVWDESFFLTGDPDTRLNYTFDLLMSSHGTCKNCSHSSAAASLTAQVFSQNGGNPTLFSTIVGRQITDSAGYQPQSQKLLISGFNGDRILVQHRFEASTSIFLSRDLTPAYIRYENEPNVLASAEVNALQTSLFYLDPITEGAGYLSGSGINYRTGAPDRTGLNPVPEPTTILLLGSGLAGLLACRRKMANNALDGGKPS
jgi:hypothetical protein